MCSTDTVQGCITARFRNHFAQDCKKLQRVVEVAQSVTQSRLPPLTPCTLLAASAKDLCQTGHYFSSQNPSGRRYGSVKVRIIRLSSSSNLCDQASERPFHKLESMSGFSNLSHCRLYPGLRKDWSENDYLPHPKGIQIGSLIGQCIWSLMFRQGVGNADLEGIGYMEN